MRSELTKATGSEMAAHVIMNNLNPAFFSTFNLDWDKFQRDGLSFVIDNKQKLSAYMWINNGRAGVGIKHESGYVKTTKKDFSF